MTTRDEPDTSALGARLTPEGAAFGLWAPRATAVDLVLIDALNEQTRLPMTGGQAGIWTVEVPGISAGQLYGFRVDGPWDPSSGSRFNPARLLLDPYARAIAGGVDFRGPILDHVAGDPYTRNEADSFGAVPLSVVVSETPPPTPVKRRRPMSETILYETHLAGFTKRHPGVPDHLRGSYLGMADPAVIDYLLELGVTAVEFLPLHHFVSEPFIAEKGLRNYWGYNTLGFFAPHAFYASLGTVGNQVSDFKYMVSKLHEAGLEVILDVVYNHTGEGGHEGPTLSMRGIDHDAYYRLTNDRRNDYDVTGCGNSVNTAHPMVLKLVLDSMRYWVREMGVDGFRFDLATTLVRDEHHRVDQSHPFKRLVAEDPTFDGIKMIVEPWDIGPYGYQVGAFGHGWHEWNDRFRDHVRDYWRGSVHGVQELATRLAGSPDIFDQPGRSPQSSINFVTAHDGFTLRDLVSYDVKHNLDNGEANRDGNDNNRSWNHGWEGETDDPSINALRRRQVLNFHATQILAAGIPMLTAGDEFGRTQKGNNNAYCQDAPISWVDWDIPPEWEDVRKRVADLIALRQGHGVLRPTDFGYHTEVLSEHGENLQRVDFAWLDGHYGVMTDQAWHDGARRLLGMYVSDAAEAFVTWFNSAANPVPLVLPGLPWGYAFEVVWHSADDTELPEGVLPSGSELTMPARSVVMMRAKVPTSAAELLALHAEEEPSSINLLS
ncbi:glycogen debranching protein GlgX [Tessaracoccus flavus]|uniref:Glycogen debranching enzyme GlgX n=1 Tax=Tessaracoccus flavus TaxID=1610493 RepID=A0A1Q2CEI6_9ACTN|nr:glycogen debranching protein GlgX [Tessaracoccus flavus]AQP44511.1 glycogen debranching enzyme GlgX [Tessaracoccus flavus]SDY71714.1 glycogen operon protein [Tessaracoccus flavus]